MNGTIEQEFRFLESRVVALEEQWRELQKLSEVSVGSRTGLPEGLPSVRVVGPEVEVSVEILGRVWVVRGFAAIADLAGWLDENGSSSDLVGEAPTL